MRPLSEDASAKMKFIYERQVENAKWRACAEFDEMMSQRHRLELTVNAVQVLSEERLNYIERQHLQIA